MPPPPSASKFLPVPFNTILAIDKCFPVTDQGAQASPPFMIDKCPHQSIISPQGVHAWAVFVANWTEHSMAERNGDDLVSWGGFLTVRISVVRLSAKALKLAISSIQMVIFANDLITLHDARKLTHPRHPRLPLRLVRLGGKEAP